MSAVAPRIANDVSYVSRINHGGHFSWPAQYLMRLEDSFFLFKFQFKIIIEKLMYPAFSNILVLSWFWWLLFLIEILIKK